MTFRRHQEDFNTIIGSQPSLDLLLHHNFAFAHEAGVFIAGRNELYITSNRIIASDGGQSVQISRVKLSLPVIHEVLDLPKIKMGNGGVNYKDGIIFCAQGDRSEPSGLFYVKIDEPQEVKLLISAFHGRPFNSLNDVVVHTDGSIWFTDPAYGYEQGYRSAPRLPNQVYRFEPSIGSLRVMADGFGHPNGICFSPDEKIVYITDTDWISGNRTTDDTRSSSM